MKSRRELPNLVAHQMKNDEVWSAEFWAVFSDWSRTAGTSDRGIFLQRLKELLFEAADDQGVELEAKYITDALSNFARRRATDMAKQFGYNYNPPTRIKAVGVKKSPIVGSIVTPRRNQAQVLVLCNEVLRRHAEGRMTTGELSQAIAKADNSVISKLLERMRT